MEQGDTSRRETESEQTSFTPPISDSGRNTKNITNIFKTKNLKPNLVILLSLVGLMYLAAYSRSSTLDSPTVLDYDPWYWYRRADDVIKNNMKIPDWDELSHYPPGRPWEPFQGWTYTIILFYKILAPLAGMSLMEAAKWSTLIVAAATVVPGFLLGKLLSNKIGGITTALFGVLSPALIGVSMGGYCDTDMIVVFYTFLVIYAIFLSLKKKFNKKAVLYYVFAIISTILFIYTWRYGWVILMFFIIFIPATFLFRIIEQITHNRKLLFNREQIDVELKRILIPILIIVFVVSILGYILFKGDNMIKIFFGAGLPFLRVTEGGMLVTISIAELQKLNILSRSGMEALIGRVGFGPVFFTFLLPILAFYKIYRKEKISSTEIFLYLWALITFALITQGVRFSLLFSTATAAAAGYVVGNIPKYLKTNFFKATFFGLTTLVIIIFISTGIAAGYAGRGMRISGNWYEMLDWLKENANPDSLIVTWWDPGHIIAGYTGLHVHGDGAQCPQYKGRNPIWGPNGYGSCYPYNHNDRIQDMGRVFSINDEEEAISILEKYKQLTPEQCSEVKQKMKETFGVNVPEGVCEEIPEMYVIASNDLIGKYYWMSYFGTGTGRNYFQMQMTNYDPNQGVIEYNRGTLNLVFDNGQWVPALNIPEQGIRNVRVSHMVYFENGQEKRLNFTDRPNIIDGMVWVDPSYTTAIFMDGTIRDSIFTRMFFFNGEGLENFELVYQNPEIRLFKVNF